MILGEAHCRGVRAKIVQTQRLGMIEQNSEDSLADREMADALGGLGFDAGVQERQQPAVGRPYAQGAIARSRQLHGRGDDAVQGGVEVQIGGQADDHS